MSGENHHLEKKSLRKVVGDRTDWTALADSCVAFATAAGGTIQIGIEDAASEPPTGQEIDPALPATIVKRMRELTVNVLPEAVIRRAENGAGYIDLHVPRSSSVPSTTSGKYYLREGDRNRPIVGDDVVRLIKDRATVSWETLNR